MHQGIKWNTCNNFYNLISSCQVFKSSKLQLSAKTAAKIKHFVPQSQKMSPKPWRDGICHVGMDTLKTGCENILIT